MQLLQVILFFLAGLSLSTFAQNPPADTMSLEQFTDRTVTIVTLTDYKLPDVNLGMNRLYVRIRKATINTVSRYFFTFDKISTDKGNGFALNYEEIGGMIAAIGRLSQEIDAALREKADYKESRYSTYRGIRVGYFVENGKVRWFIDGAPNALHIYYRTIGSINVADIGPFEKALIDAKRKIDQMMDR
ncbi:hypothetical protein [Spirosoma montaniterrae]|uniref:Uncharacterized protein n=1 Tax=Spirosoma montaniterrae TaxID=1178516 RepID=A0A1P9WSW5_9BACT|nr:hypothetical protein [Spirosoma montaniterrae]AQG78430.1 hypothetical protein AWR27_03200 [Spirosoma montaniterrae]